MTRPLAAGRRIPVLGLVTGISIVLMTSCAGDGRDRVTVLAASSLTEAFVQVEAAFEAAHEDVDLVVSTGGSPSLAAQAVEGSPADLLITADDTSMQRAVAAGIVTGRPKAIATNVVVGAASSDTSSDVQTLDALADSGLLLSLCAPEVPCGSAARELVEAAGLDVEPDSLESSVQGVVTRLALGEVDVGIVYATDISASDGALRPLRDDVVGDVGTVRYKAAILEGDRGAGADLLDFLVSAEGRRLLRDNGFGAP